MLSSKIIIYPTAGLSLLAMVVFLAACVKQAEQTFISDPKPVSIAFAADEVKLIEFRLGNADLELAQDESGWITIEGELAVGASDLNAANIQALRLELDVVQGHVAIISLPAPPEGVTHIARLKVNVPRGVNLRVNQSEGSVRGSLNLPLMTDIELGAGAVELTLPRDASAFVAAEVNIAAPVDFSVSDFAKIEGRPERQLTHVAFNGQVGTPLQLVGSRLEVRVNAGSCKIHGAAAEEITTPRATP